MKKLLLNCFLIIFIFSYTAVAQTFYKLDESHYFQWQDPDWIEKNYTLYEYNNGGTKQTAETDYSSSDGMTFVNDYQTNLSYNGDNNVIEVISSFYNGSSWENSLRETYEYNVDKTLKTDTFYDWNGSSWVRSSEERYTYTSNGYEVEHWDLTSGYDVVEGREIVELNAQSQVVSVTSQTGVMDSPTTYHFVNSFLINYSYSATLLDYIEQFDYNTSVPNDWSTYPIYKSDYVRASTNPKLVVTDYVGDGTMATLIKNSQTIYNYNSQDYVQDTTFQIWDNSQWLTQKTETLGYDSNQNQNLRIVTIYDPYNYPNILSKFKYEQVWSEAAALSVTFQEITKTKAYPNPTYNEVSLKFEQPTATLFNAKIYDVTGRLLTQKTIYQGTAEVSFDLINNPKGVYFLHLNDTNTDQTFKIIKQ